MWHCSYGLRLRHNAVSLLTKRKGNKMYKLVSILILATFNLFSQEISFNKNSLGYYFNQPYFPEYDSIMVYNNGSNLLVIDSIYSKNEYGYKLNLDSIYSDKFFYVFIGLDSLYITIEPNDSVELFFSYPDFCPICKNSLDINAFSDTLVFYSNSVSNNYSYIIVEGDGSTDVEEDDLLLNSFILYQNYPNPFNPSTNISYQLKENGFVNLKVYNFIGETVAELVNQRQAQGNYSIAFNAANLPSGIYLYKLQTDNFSDVKKMILLR